MFVGAVQIYWSILIYRKKETTHSAIATILRTTLRTYPSLVRSSTKSARESKREESFKIPGESKE